MQRFIAAFLGLCLLAFGLHVGHERAYGQMHTLKAGSTRATAASGCSEATTFLARTSGLSGTSETNVTTLICAWVANGTITGDLTTTGCGSKFEAVYLLGLTNTTNARLNICSTSFTITANGTPAWATYGSGVGGYTGVAASTSVYLNTGLNTSTSTIFTRDCAHFSVWNNTNAASASFYIMMGNAAGSSDNQIFAKASTGDSYVRVNNTSAAGATAYTIADPRGLLVANRSDASTIQAYQNTTQVATASAASSARTSANMYILAQEAGGGATGGDNKEAMAASIGSCLTGTQVTNFYTPLHTFLTNEAGIAY